MKPSSFVGQLHEIAIKENMGAYRDMFGSTGPGEAKDPYFQRAAQLFGGLSAEHQAVIFEVLQQVAIDAVSNVLGVIDGTSYFPGNPEFLLTVDGKPLNGDLQDLFLGAVEEGQKEA